MGWEKASEGECCDECGETLEEGEDVYVATGAGGETYCEGCNEDLSEDYYDDRECEDDYLIDGVGFADPGGNSALRAETDSNPRNLPCGGCGRDNLLTPLDKRAGYVCDSCADKAEGRGYGHGDY